MVPKASAASGDPKSFCFWAGFSYRVFVAPGMTADQTSTPAGTGRKSGGNLGVPNSGRPVVSLDRDGKQLRESYRVRPVHRGWVKSTVESLAQLLPVYGSVLDRYKSGGRIA